MITKTTTMILSSYILYDRKEEGEKKKSNFIIRKNVKIHGTRPANHPSIQQADQPAVCM